ncbi:MAG: type II toxin-antitoxin system RelE/ParE family toxin [Proteobacteria bacterium]|nr:type II toxin-antitoxin system RelE/ParE family toxin [Pseudomonadota bacterium]
MVAIRQPDEFAAWLRRLRDPLARARAQVRLDRHQLGPVGDVKPVGEGVSELRVNYGPGYRVYFARRGAAVVILLAGGDKRTQQRDIELAVELMHRLEH